MSAMALHAVRPRSLAAALWALLALARPVPADQVARPPDDVGSASPTATMATPSPADTSLRTWRDDRGLEPYVYPPSPTVTSTSALTFTPTPTLVEPRLIFIAPSATFTPYSTPTSTATFTVTATFTPVPTAEAGCQWATFRLSSDDDASWTRIDASSPTGAWPPAGGSGPDDVTGDNQITVLVEGASDTLAALSAFGETPPGVAWPSVLNREVNGAWTIENLGVLNQSTIDFRAVRLPSHPDYIIPWVETEPHAPCGAGGLESDIPACDPDIVVVVPEANDSMWPNLFPEQLQRGPQDLVAALIRQCDAVVASNPNRVCLVPTMSKAPYVATWPATNRWIERANLLIRQTFPNTRVVDFTTGSSNALDYYHTPFAYEATISHSNQRPHDVRAGRVLAALTKSAFTATAPVLQAETRLWNGVSGLSVVGMRWDTSSLPDNVDVRKAVVEVRSTYRGAPGAGTETRSVGLQWANGAAEDGWQADDWPASLSPTAYSGAPEIGAAEERGIPWSFALTDPGTVSATGYTGLYAFVTPSALPPADTYFNYDVISYDSALGPEKVCVGRLGTNAGTPCPAGNECTGDAICLAGRACVGGSEPGAPCSVGDECSGGTCLASDGAPKFHVYYCAPTVTATPDVPTPTFPPTPPAATCVGDCDASGDVSIGELITGVNIARATLALDRCPAFDPSGRGRVEINELIIAVSNALNGCS
jgi:hypothetical protein